MPDSVLVLATAPASQLTVLWGDRQHRHKQGVCPNDECSRCGGSRWERDHKKPQRGGNAVSLEVTVSGHYGVRLQSGHRQRVGAEGAPWKVQCSGVGGRDRKAGGRS